MSQKSITSDNGKTRLKAEELIDLFKHFDEMHAGKENLFIPIILAIIPAILLSWKDVDARIVAVAGMASILLYVYHLLVTRRYSAIQGRLFQKMGELTSDVEDIVRYPVIFGISALRIYLLGFLSLFWFILYFLKATRGGA